MIQAVSTPVYQHIDLFSNLPTLRELRKHRTAPLQPFSKMGNTKIKTIQTVKSIARYQGKRVVVGDTESFNHHSGHKKDMFGIFDALAIESKHTPSLVLDAGMDAYLASFTQSCFRGIQACGNDWQEHIRKLRDGRNIETCALWLSAGTTTIELWGWRKVKRSGFSMKVYRPRVQVITLAFLLGHEPAKIIEIFQD